MRFDLQPAASWARAAEGWRQVRADGEGLQIEALVPEDTAEPVVVALVRYPIVDGAVYGAELEPEVLVTCTYASCHEQIDVLLDLRTAACRLEWYRAVPA